MSYVDQISLAQDAVFLKRVEYAITQSAINVRSESSTALNHAQRSNWAGQVLGNPIGFAALMAVAFVTQNPVAGSAVCTTTGCSTVATDAQLQIISDSLWNDYAIS